MRNLDETPIPLTFEEWSFRDQIKKPDCDVRRECLFRFGSWPLPDYGFLERELSGYKIDHNIVVVLLGPLGAHATKVECVLKKRFLRKPFVDALIFRFRDGDWCIWCYERDHVRWRPHKLYESRPELMSTEQRNYYNKTGKFLK